MNGFTVLAEPTRRALIDRLRVSKSDVGGLMRELGLSQSLVSKHLRVLRETGIVEAEIAGKRRVYRLSERPFPDVLAWITPYVARWQASFDQLAKALDEEDHDD